MNYTRKIRNYNNQDVKDLKENSLAKPFRDYTFMADDKTIGSEIFFNQLPPISWKRVKEVCPEMTLRDLTKPGNVVTFFGNWNVAIGLSALATHTDLFKKVVLDNINDDCDLNSGIYNITLWHGEWYNVVIDEFLPLSTFNQYIFAHSETSKTCLWPSLVEKALAKLFGSYEALGELSFDVVFTSLTGGVIFPKLLNSYTPKALIEAYDFFHSNLKKKFPVVLQITPLTKDDIGQRNKMGLIIGYGFLVIQQKLVKLPRESTKRVMVKLRRLWGGTEMGDLGCQSSSPVWSTMTLSKKKKLHLMAPNKDEFWMTLNDLVDNFDSIFGCLFYSHPWVKKSKKGNVIHIKGTWKTKKHITRVDIEDDAVVTYFQKPQIKFDVKVDETEIYFYLLQVTPTEKMNSMGINLIEVEANRQYRIQSTANKNLHSSYTSIRGMSLLATLKRGRYIAIISSEGLNMVGNYLFRFASEAHIKISELLYNRPKNPWWSRNNSILLGTAIAIQSINGIDDLNTHLVLCFTCNSQRHTSYQLNLNKPLDYRVIFYHRENKPITIKLCAKIFGIKTVLGRAELIPELLPVPNEIEVDLKLNDTETPKVISLTYLTTTNLSLL